MENYITRYIPLVDFIKLGGTPIAGMKLYTNPHHPPIRKELTFIEIVPGKGVRVENEEDLFGTGWVYTEQKLKLWPNIK